MNRRKSIIFIFYFLLLAFGLFAQDTWVKNYQPFGEDVSYFVEDIRVCPDEGYAVIGSIWDEWEGNRGYMMKTDSDGNLQWASIDTVDFIGNPEPSGFVVLDDGSFITVGNDLGFGNSYLLKRTTEGVIEWVEELEAGYRTEAIELTNDSNLITTGGATMDDPINLQKFDLDGNLIWRQTYLPDGFEFGQGNSVIQTTDGGYALTGSVYGINNNDIIILKTNDAGDSLWTWTYDGFGMIDRGNCIINTFDGDILVGGYLNCSPPIYHYGFLGRFDQTGNNLFIHQFESWHIRSCLQDIDNNYVIYSGLSMLKTNEVGDTLWYNGFPYYGHFGDRCFQKVEDYFICLTSQSGDSIELIKTDSTGNVTSANEEVIFSIKTNPIVCYPNPFNPTTIISFNINKSSKVEINAYNCKGQKMLNLLDEVKEIGNHSITWNANEFASGVYFIQFIQDNKLRSIQKVSLIK
jgi:hypothetical protein